MHADFQYEYFNDRSFFQDKSYRAVEGWKNLGRAAWDNPLGMVVPGVMEAWRNPTSPAAWGKAAVDIGLIGFSAAKIGNAARLGRVGRIGEEFATFGKIGNFTEEVSTINGAISQGIKRYDAIHVTPRGVALPSGSKYQIPGHYVENIHRPGSYGEYLNGKFVERLRIDPATPPGMKGPNYSHYRNGSSTHYRSHPKNTDPGFNP